MMSNYGLEQYFKTHNINFIRANVGDRYVKEQMQKHKFNLGGEQSGHIILGKFATTGDGLLVALETLFALRKGKKASVFFSRFKKIPQILKNINVKDKNIINNSDIKKSITILKENKKNYIFTVSRNSNMYANSIFLNKLNKVRLVKNKTMLNKNSFIDAGQFYLAHYKTWKNYSNIWG